MDKTAVTFVLAVGLLQSVLAAVPLDGRVCTADALGAGMGRAEDRMAFGYGTMQHADPNLAEGMPIRDVLYQVSADGKTAEISLRRVLGQLPDIAAGTSGVASL